MRRHIFCKQVIYCHVVAQPFVTPVFLLLAAWKMENITKRSCHMIFNQSQCRWSYIHMSALYLSLSAMWDVGIVRLVLFRLDLNHVLVSGIQHYIWMYSHWVVTICWWCAGLQALTIFAINLLITYISNNDQTSRLIEQHHGIQWGIYVTFETMAGGFITPSTTLPEPISTFHSE